MSSERLTDENAMAKIARLRSRDPEIENEALRAHVVKLEAAVALREQQFKEYVERAADDEQQLRAHVAQLEAALTNLLTYALNGEGAGLIPSEMELDPVFIEARAALKDAPQ